MSEGTIISCILTIGVVVTLLAVIPRRKPEVTDPLSGYLLAGGTLRRVSVGSLLMSSSFALNSLFYGAWLGYSIGVYALAIQALWTASFFLLAPHAPRIKASKSLHAFLGRFGSRTRLVAGACSLVGMMYLIGWEAAILKDAFATLLIPGNGTPSVTGAIALILVLAVVAVALLYTVIGGLRGNARADTALNVTKIVCLVWFIWVVGVMAKADTDFSWYRAFNPSLDDLRLFGLAGFVTNAIFNVVWQFVDASSWQSIVAGKETTPGDSAANVRASGLAIFVAPGLLATVFGILAHSVAGVTADNIIGHVAIVSTALAPLTALVATIMIVCCVMSLLDGMFLAVAYAFVIDVTHPQEPIEALEADPTRAERILFVIRLVLVAAAAISVVGVNYLLPLLGRGPFDFVYVVIISQLSLAGPILLGLWTTRVAGSAPMWLAIAGALIVGFGSVWLGTIGWEPKLVDWSGTLTVAASCVLAYFLSAKKN